MATTDGENSAVIDALALGQIELAGLLLSEENSLDLQRATKVVIDKGQYEAMKFLLNRYKLDVDRHYLLHHALARQQEDIAKLLIESGADVNKLIPRNSEEDRKYFFPLPLKLSLKCSLDMTRFLLEFKADINKPDHSGETTLICACRTYPICADRVAFLLQHGADVHDKDSRGATALHHAARVGSNETVKLLIDHGADIDAKEGRSHTALMFACMNSNIDCLQVLLEKGAKCHLQNWMKETGLHMAAHSGNPMAVKLLIQYGTQLEARTNNGDTALILACKERDRAECVRILLENGAFPNVKNVDRCNPLKSVKRRAIIGKIFNDTKAQEIMEMLLQYGATEEDKIDQKEIDLMMACGGTGYVRSVLSLQEHGISPNVKTPRGQTALHIAADTGDVESLKRLVQYGADVNIMDDADTTPLMLACSNVNVDIVKFLLENKALPNVTDIRGETALHHLMGSNLSYKSSQWASRIFHWSSPEKKNTALPEDYFHHSCEIVKLLVQHRADLEARTSGGETPFLTAARIGNRHIIELLHDLGVDVCAEDDYRQNAVNKYLLKGSSNSDPEILQYLIDKGVSVNRRDRDDCTLLMNETIYESHGVKILDCLIKAGADVHAVTIQRTDRGRMAFTAFSYLLLNGVRRYDYAERLAKCGAVNSLPQRFNSSLHKLIDLGNFDAIPLLLTNGMAPTMSDSTKPLRFGYVGPVSPLTVALDRGHIVVVKNLLGNLMLCPCDIYGHAYFSQWRSILISKNTEMNNAIVTMMDEFYSQPKSLFQLSFVTVSHALSGVPGRVDRVNSLPLPSKIKDTLLFKNINEPICSWSTLKWYFERKY